MEVTPIKKEDQPDREQPRIYADDACGELGGQLNVLCVVDEDGESLYLLDGRRGTVHGPSSTYTRKEYQKDGRKHFTRPVRIKSIVLEEID